MSAQRGFAPLILIIAIVLILAVVIFFLFQKDTPQFTNLTPQNKSQESKSDFSYELSDKKLLFQGGFADPSVIKLISGDLIMYVNKFGNGGSKNLILSSKNGIDWKQTQYNAPGSSTARGFVTESGVRLYYPTQTPINPSDPPSQILSALSKDGFTFTNEEGVRMKPEAGYTIEGPSVIKLADGKLRMYFDEFKADSAQERRGGRIIGATSSDGLTWIRDQKSSIESDEIVEKAPADWPQALRPFVIKRPQGGFVMFYNSHSKIFAAYSEDGYSWKKLGGIGLKGADIDAYYLPDGNIRIYLGDFSEATSGVVYTGILKEVEERTTTDEVMDAPNNVKPVGGNKPPPPPECEGKSATDPNLSQPCQMWFKIQ